MNHIKQKALVFLLLLGATLTSCADSGSSDNPNSFVTNEVFYKTRFLNYDGSFLYLSRTKKGESAVYDGPLPTRDESDVFMYTFEGWNKSLDNIQADTVFYANYREEAITYFDVYFVNYDDSPLYYHRVRAGGSAIYEGLYPMRDSEDGYEYTFAGWNRPLTNISENTTFTATYSSKQQALEVLFLNYDGTLLDKVDVYPGDTPVYGAPIPIRENSASTSYVFAGWDKPLSDPIYYDTIFTAQFSESVSTNVVTFLNYDGSFLYEVDVLYGHPAEMPGMEPERPTAGRYRYEFLGWDKDISSVTNSIEVKAVYNQFVRDNSNGLEYLISVNDAYISYYDGEDKDVYIGRFFIDDEDNEYPIRGIRANAFRANEYIESVYLENNIISIDDEAFAYAKNLKNVVPSPNLQRIGDNAFTGTMITNFEIPASVTTIGSSAFYELPLNATITVNLKNENFKIKKNFLLSGDGKTLYSTITEQRDHNVEFPEGIETFESDLITDSEVVYSYIFPSTTKLIKANAFAKNHNLSEVTFNNAAAIISEGAFFESKALQTLDLGSELLEIHGDNFTLSKLRTLTVPASVRKVANSAFNGSLLLGEIIVDAANKNYVSLNKALFTKNRSELIRIPASLRGSFTIPAETTALENILLEQNSLSVFIVEPGNSRYKAVDGVILNYGGSEVIKGPGLIKVVEIPASVTAIRSYAFANTKNLMRITFNHNLKTIGAYAFMGNTGIETLVFPNSLTTIEVNAFANMSELKSITFGTGLKQIKDETFIEANKLEEVFFSDEITSIGVNAFKNSKIKKLTFGNDLVTIGEGAFSGNEYLEEIVFNSNLKTINSEAFLNAKRLKSLEFNNSLEYIGNHAFATARSVKSIVFGNNLTTIGDFAFSGLDVLEELSFNAKLKNLGEGAFSDNYALEKIVINDQLEVIRTATFSNAYNLKYLVLGAKVREIGSDAFANSENLEWIIASPVSVVAYDAFDGSANSLNLFFYDTGAVDLLRYTLNSPTLYFYSEDQLFGNYWHYVDGKPVIWK